jgi:hypothetical protein
MHFRGKSLSTTQYFFYQSETAISGNVKLNNVFKLSKGFDAQLTAVYLAPDIIPQGKIG